MVNSMNSGKAKNRPIGGNGPAGPLSALRGLDKVSQVEGSLKRGILTGQFPANRALPKMTDLAQTYGTSTVTVRMALDRLSAQGLLQSYRRRGTFVQPDSVQRLRTGRRLVAYRIASPGARPSQFGGYTGRILGGIVEGTNTQGSLAAVLLDSVSDSRHDSLRRYIEQQDASGVIAFGHICQEDLDALASLGIPAVIVGFPIPAGAGPDQTRWPLDCVASDSRSVYFEAVKYLASLGHRSMLVLTMTGSYSSDLLLEGFESAVEQTGLNRSEQHVVSVATVAGPNTVEDAVEQTVEQAVASAIQRMVDESSLPDAILTAGSTISAAAYLKLREASMEVPRHVSILGSGAVEMPVLPSFTHMDCLEHDQGMIAVDRLLRRMDGETLEPQTIMVKPRLVLGQTTTLRSLVPGEVIHL